MVEVEVTKPASPMIEVMTPQGMEEIESALQGHALEPDAEAHEDAATVRVPEALDILAQEEAAQLIDMEAATQEAIRRVDVALAFGRALDRGFERLAVALGDDREDRAACRPSLSGRLEQPREQRVGARDLAAPCRPSAIAIGVDWKKRMKRTSAARCGSVASPRARLSTSVREAPGAPSAPNATLWNSRTGTERPPRVLKSRSSTSVFTSPGAAPSVVSSAAPSPDTMSVSFRPPEPTCARSWSSQAASVALR